MTALGSIHPSSAPSGTTAILHTLRQACSATTSTARSRTIPTGLPALDESLPAGGLTCAGIHEWLGVSDPDAQDPARMPRFERGRNGGAEWSPPLTVLSLLAARALDTLERATHDHAFSLIWVGRAVWPYAPALPRHALDRSIFIRTQRPADRLWAADLALRSRAAAAVILDASGFDLAATRRLQLAAESASTSREVGGLCLLARPPWERAVLSAATTRWSIRRCVSHHHARRWSVELLRCKGVRPTDHALPLSRAWTLEQAHATRALAVVPDVLHRSRPSQVEANTIRRTA